MDLALVAGQGPELLARYEGYGALVDEAAIVALGFRDHLGEGVDGSQAIFGTSVRLLDLASVRRLGPAAASAQALQAFRAAGVAGFWIHYDVDVLDSTLMPAVDDPQPDGLTYEESTAIVRPLLDSELAAGMQVTIYDPDRDPDGAAGRQLADWLVDLFSS